MIITPLATPRITPRSAELLTLIEAHVPDMPENSVLAISSKVVALCEGSSVPIESTDKHQLIVQQAECYLPRSASDYNVQFTVVQHTLIPSAGIDASNGGDHYVLWPKDAQATANLVRRHILKHFKRSHLGVIITDSTCRPLRRGVTGIAVAHSGFAALNDYIGKPDLFERPFTVSQADISGGLAAAATVAMGEGAESTPLCLLSDMPNVVFQDRDPSKDELDDLHLYIEDDLFAPFLGPAAWQPGGQSDSATA